MNRSFKSTPTGSSRRASQPVVSGVGTSVGAAPRRASMMPGPPARKDPLSAPSPSSSSSSSSSQPYDKASTAPGEASAPRKTKVREAGVDAGPTFDADRYNPDGSTRTVYTMPSLEEGLAKAKNARHLRLRDTPPEEKELTIGQIFN
ncbi:uncharacterized protein LOC143289876 isoform X2 [Babylonia areolata]|uniref:uncharacterized protein LOC143289876 isoform X2 n=1 Tax=Babylonia areolata TaxID=304850 RepID=UPI003FD123C9